MGSLRDARAWAQAGKQAVLKTTCKQRSRTSLLTPSGGDPKAADDLRAAQHGTRPRQTVKPPGPRKVAPESGRALAPAQNTWVTQRQTGPEQHAPGRLDDWDTTWNAAPCPPKGVRGSECRLSPLDGSPRPPSSDARRRWGTRLRPCSPLGSARRARAAPAPTRPIHR